MPSTAPCCQECSRHKYSFEFRSSSDSVCILKSCRFLDLHMNYEQVCALLLFPVTHHSSVFPSSTPTSLKKLLTQCKDIVFAALLFLVLCWGALCAPCAAFTWHGAMILRCRADFICIRRCILQENPLIIHYMLNNCGNGLKISL